LYAQFALKCALVRVESHPPGRPLCARARLCWVCPTALRPVLCAATRARVRVPQMAMWGETVRRALRALQKPCPPLYDICELLIYVRGITRHATRPAVPLCLGQQKVLAGHALPTSTNWHLHGCVGLMSGSVSSHSACLLVVPRIRSVFCGGRDAVNPSCRCLSFDS
jgi:hypothetical protein